MSSSRIFLVISIVVIALPSAAGAAERDVNCWDCNSANLDGLNGIDLRDIAILADYWLQVNPEVDIIADGNVVDFNDFAIMSKFWQWPCEGITVIFEEPPPGTQIRSQHYMLRASTPDCNVVRAEFRIADVYWENYIAYCDPNGIFELMCDCNTPSQAFECLADFTLNYLNPRDTYMCLRAELFDNEDNSERAYRLVEVDNDIPDTITDLSATPAGTNGYIDLSWTAPSENGLGVKPVSNYIIKIATTPILTDEDFDNAGNIQGACSVKSPSSPETLESCTQTPGDLPGYEPNSETVYYYAIKSVDDAGNVSELSNCSGTVATWHDVTVDSIECVVTKNGCECNDVSSNTVYLYDTLNVSGYITNHGNVDETVTAELKVLGGSVVDTQEVFIAKGETKLVNGLQWSAIGTMDQGLRLQVGSNSKDYKWFRVWSISEHVVLSWYDPNLYPAPVEAANEKFYVTVNIGNSNNQADYWDIPLRLETGTEFSVCAVGPLDICVGDDKQCYMDLLLSDSDYHYWQVNGLPAGTYTVRVIAGEHPLDEVVVERTIEIMD